MTLPGSTVLGEFDDKYVIRTDEVLQCLRNQYAKSSKETSKISKCITGSPTNS